MRQTKKLKDVLIDFAFEKTFDSILHDIYLNINSRQKLFRHKHEAESGRTSSVGNDILGFDSSGQVTSF